MEIFQFSNIQQRFCSSGSMKLVEVLISLCIVSSSFAILFSKPCPSNVYAVRHSEDVSNIKDTCLCPNNGHQVADILSKQNSDLERVVVFYYRDKTNNEVYMYTPSGSKQLVIPELQYDTEDDLEKVDNQVSMRLFDISPANVMLQTYQYPNYNRHRHHQHTRPGLTHSSKVDYYSPQAWHYRQTWYNQLRPDGSKSNNEVDNGDNLIPYDYNLRDKKKWAIRNKKFNSQNIQGLVNNADYAIQAASAKSYDFNKWYSQNVIQFPEIYSGDQKYITFNDLREQLLRIFNEHGYSIINNQVLDPQGEVAESSNYKLVRVKIKQDNDEKHLTSEVEGIMVISLVPMTILGVVPLTNNIEETDIEVTEKEQISDEQSVGRVETKGIVGTSKNITQDSATKEAVTPETAKTSSTKKSRPLDVLLNNLVHAVNRLVPHRRESDASVDAPGYRIIGGNAATGSGAPISSKGRSGTPH